MIDFKEFAGKNTEEALDKAADYFHLPLNRLEVEMVSAGSSGLFGFLGAKKAKVRVRPLAGSGLEAEMAALAAVVGENHHPRAARPAFLPELQPEPKPEPAPAQAAPPAPSVAAPRPAVDQTSQPAPLPTAPLLAKQREVDTEIRPRQDSAGLEAELEVEVEELAPGQELEDEAALAGADLEDEAEGQGDQRLEQDPQVIAQALEVLTRLVAPLDPSASVTAQGGPQGIELSVQGQEVGMLIGRRGQNLEALQYITTRIVSHRHGRPVRIVVDAGEYRRRRRESLEDLARRMAQKARQSGRAVAVGPLSAQERRVVHLALKGEAGLTTSSRGRGELKKVVISPQA